jgi:N-acetylglucosamine-6-sulfatase
VRRGAAWLGPAAFIAALALGWSQDEPNRTASATAASTPAPNIVLIQTDDQTNREFTREAMPETKRLLADHGTTFSRYMVTTAECCPSRASLLTGQYAHNHGVTSNQTAYPALIAKGNVLPSWLHDAGYATLHVGKFLNKYQDFADPPTEVAPGWDKWYTIMGDAPYYDYDYYVNGSLRHRGSSDADYVTRVLDRRATKLVDTYAPKRKPFFLELDERAPHTLRGRDRNDPCQRAHGAIPDPRDEGSFAHVKLPRPASFNEKDMSDKPSFIRDQPPLDRSAKRQVRRRWECALESLRGVDRGVGRVFDAVRRSGELGRTVFVFNSDNGLFFGEHRIDDVKVLPYEEAIRVPLVMRVPKRYRQGAKRLAHSAAPVANIDVAPTILQLAGATPCASPGDCRTMDGRSLLPILRRTGGFPRNRGLLTEYSRTNKGESPVCVFDGITTPAAIYVRYTSVVDPSTGNCEPADAQERYDLKSDPGELDNLCVGGGGCPADQRQVDLESRLAELADCAGIAGRDPLPPSGHYCE